MISLVLASACFALASPPNAAGEGPREYDLAAQVARAELVVVAREVGHVVVPVAFPDGSVRLDAKVVRRVVVEETLKGAAPPGEIAVVGSQITSGAPGPAVLFLTPDGEHPGHFRRIGQPHAIYADPWGRAMTHNHAGTAIYLRVGAQGVAVVIEGADPGEELYRSIDEALSSPNFDPGNIPSVPLPPRPPERTLTPTQDFSDALAALRALVGQAANPEARAGRAP